MSELKSCPICGNHAYLAKSSHFCPKDIRFWVECTKCWCKTNDSGESIYAIQKWNSRWTEDKALTVEQVKLIISYGEYVMTEDQIANLAHAIHSAMPPDQTERIKELVAALEKSTVLVLAFSEALKAMPISVEQRMKTWEIDDIARQHHALISRIRGESED